MIYAIDLLRDFLVEGFWWKVRGNLPGMEDSITSIRKYQEVLRCLLEAIVAENYSPNVMENESK